MDRIIVFLDTYKGRDKILRLLCYSSKFIAGSLPQESIGAQFDRFSSQLSTSRACFRLLDDLPTIIGVLRNHSKAKDDMSTLSRAIDFLENIVDLLFCPLDHLSWAQDHKIIKGSELWDTASTLFWVISLYISIFKAVMRMVAISRRKMLSRRTSEAKRETAEQWKLQMTTLKCILDLMFAVSYLPKGLLWAKFFTKKGVGALGTASSLISLYQALLL